MKHKDLKDWAPTQSAKEREGLVLPKKKKKKKYLKQRCVEFN